MTTANDDLAEIRARLAGASPGPWEAYPGWGRISDGNRNCIAQYRNSNFIQPDEQEANGKFIAHAPTDIAFLLSRVDALSEELVRTQKFLTGDPESPRGKYELAHELYCNVSRDNPVGCEGCSCRAGREIRRLSEELAGVREALETKGIAQAWRDGFLASVETVKSFTTNRQYTDYMQVRDDLADILQRASAKQHERLSRPTQPGNEGVGE